MPGTGPAAPLGAARVRRRTPLGRALLILLLLAGGAAAVYLVTRGPDYRFATSRFENEAGGYAFNYPDGWELTRNRRTTKLEAPDHSVVVSLGVGPSQGLRDASGRLVDEVRRTYRTVQLTGSQSQTIGDQLALAVYGTGKNDAGVSLRFVAVVIQGPSPRTTFAITAFTAADADPKKVVPILSEIVDSFRPT